MTDKELADKVIALGVGYQGTYPLSCDGVGFYHEPYEDGGMCAELYVRDWRCAGALMEKLTWQQVCTLLKPRQTTDDIVEPRAIIEGCVEALP